MKIICRLEGFNDKFVLVVMRGKSFFRHWNFFNIFNIYELKRYILNIHSYVSLSTEIVTQ